MTFHDVRFPTAVSLGAIGGPERRTDVVVLGSGAEERNARWADSQRRYNAGYGVTSHDQLHAVLAFFEERRGRLYGFRWRDALDNKSCAPSVSPAATDQLLGSGTGTRASFDLIKTYGSSHAPYQRRITKPIASSVKIAVAGTLVAATAYTVDHAIGRIIFNTDSIPAVGAMVTAGFEFDVPVRFDTDKLEVNLSSFRAGAIPSIPLIEIRS